MAAIRPPRMPHLPRQMPRVARGEPGTLPAAMLALIVHAGFFTVIVFGVSWQVKHPEPVMAELWDQLPSIRNAPEPPAPVVEPEPEVKKIVEPPPVEHKPLPPQPTKADIQLKAKLEKAEREKAERERVEKQKQVELEKKRKEEEAQKKAAKAADDKARADQASRDAAINNARSEAQKNYADKIASLISNRANIPDTVSGKPVLTVRVKLLVNQAKAVFPAAGDYGADLKPWCGLRPATPKGTPILGASPIANLFLNAGHGALGWTLSCGCAKAVSDLISGVQTGIALEGLTLAS